MVLGMMQPYFFPYLGHFALLYSADKWVVLDESQYTPKSWMNRNRILKPTSEKFDQSFQYFSLPLKKSSISLKIKEVEIKDFYEAKKMMQGKISIYKKAPYFKEVREIIENTFHKEETNLSKINIRSIMCCANYLGIDFDPIVFSELPAKDEILKNISSPDDWALYTALNLNMNKYINPFGGKLIFDLEKYKKFNVNLNFLDFRQETYSDKLKGSNFRYIENLSIVDVMMWNSPNEIMTLIENGISFER